jgi:magnesium-protoporphyrin O-methyltransferase
MPDEPCACGCPNTFDAKMAEGDLKRYLKKGADGTTRSLIDAIVGQGIEGATLLDIGGGIGAIQLELLAAGAERATAVDATEAYVQVARAEAVRRGYGERVRPLVGTFETLASEIETADIVTLDRVVCCDPDLPGLLGSVVTHARRMVGLVYPRETWWNRIAARLLAVWGWLTRDSTRWHLHRTAEIEAILRGAGFGPRTVDRSLIWHVVLYVREGVPA